MVELVSHPPLFYYCYFSTAIAASRVSGILSRHGRARLLPALRPAQRLQTFLAGGHVSSTRSRRGTRTRGKAFEGGSNLCMDQRSKTVISNAAILRGTHIRFEPIRGNCTFVSISQDCLSSVRTLARVDGGTIWGTCSRCFPAMAGSSPSHGWGHFVMVHNSELGRTDQAESLTAPHLRWTRRSLWAAFPMPLTVFVVFLPAVLREGGVDTDGECCPVRPPLRPPAFSSPRPCALCPRPRCQHHYTAGLGAPRPARAGQGGRELREHEGAGPAKGRARQQTRSEHAQRCRHVSTGRLSKCARFGLRCVLEVMVCAVVLVLGYQFMKGGGRSSGGPHGRRKHVLPYTCPVVW